MLRLQDLEIEFLVLDLVPAEILPREGRLEYGQADHQKSNRRQPSDICLGIHGRPPFWIVERGRKNRPLND
jgi:hypothetical protein